MTPVTLSDLEYLCLHMRAEDQREVYGLASHENPFLLAHSVVYALSLGKGGIATYKDRPVGVVGVYPHHPGTWQAMAFGTDEMPKAALSMTRFALGVLRPFVLARGAHRLECQSRFDHTSAHDWLHAIGAVCEGTLRGYGKDGADYLSFSWARG